MCVGGHQQFVNICALVFLKERFGFGVTKGVPKNPVGHADPKRDEKGKCFWLSRNQRHIVRETNRKLLWKQKKMKN